MTPDLRWSAVTALAMLTFGCSSGGGSGGGPAIPEITLTCTPAFVEKLGTSQCSAVIDGQAVAVDSIDWSVNSGSINVDGLFLAPGGAGSTTVTASHMPTSATGTVNVVVSGSRSLVDLPDDAAGYQVHVVYAVAADTRERVIDTNGTLALSVEAWNAWFEAQTGSRLRLDTVGGALDISFVRLGRSDADMNDYGDQLRDQLESELIARGFSDPYKTYLVYYEGGDAASGSCGGGAWPPDLPGSVAAIYLQAIPASGPPCSDNQFAGNVNAPGYLEFAALHEVLHVFGIVPACAPNHVLAGHVADSPTDIMYAGQAAWDPSEVDVGRNDYFEAPVAGCVDLAESLFLDPQPTPQAFAPPGWPYATLAAMACSAEATAQSTPGGTPTAIQFVNATDSDIIVYRLDETGTRQFRTQLEPWEGFIETTETTHPYVVTSDTAVCLGVYMGASVLGRAVVTAP